MNEVIGTILEAEKRAEEIVRAAEEKAKTILAEGEREAEQLNEDAKRSFLAYREETIAAAEQSADERYRAILEQGKGEADALRASCRPRTAKAAHDVVRKVFGA